MRFSHNKDKWAASNERFCEMAAVTPLERQCGIGSYYPAGSSVKPPPRKAAGRYLQAADSAAGFGSKKNNKKMKYVTGIIKT